MTTYNKIKYIKIEKKRMRRKLKNERIAFMQMLFILFGLLLVFIHQIPV